MVKNWLVIVFASLILISLIVHSFADEQSDRREQMRIRGAKRYMQRCCDARYAGESWSSCITKLQAYCLPRRNRSTRMCRMLLRIPKEHLGTSAKEDQQTQPALPTWEPSAGGGGTSQTTNTQTAPPTPTTQKTTTHDAHVGHTDDAGFPTGGTVKPAMVCHCAPWASWATQCSQDCGGCGTRVRRRECGGNKDCYETDKANCNTHPCGPDQRLLMKNDEVHIVWQGCCLGMFKNVHGRCDRLDRLTGNTG